MDDLNRRLYAYDNLEVLNDPLALPTDSVDLIYLDPPFNSNSTYNLPFKRLGRDVAAVAAFQDTWMWGEVEDAHLRELERGAETRVLADVVRVAQSIEGRRVKRSLAAYLVNMAVRLIPLKRVLKDSGSIYLHCDPTASHYLKLLMDAIFGQASFRNEIVWHYSGWNKKLKYHLERRHDAILFYAPSRAKQQFAYPARPWADREEYVSTRKQKVRVDDEGREYVLSDAGGGRRIRRYLDEAMAYGVPLDDVWDIPKLNNSDVERLGYPTQKPRELLERIIASSSQPGDIVLDPFCGCGTTMHAAENLGRRWVGIDISRFSTGLVRERLLDNIPTLSAADFEMLGVPRYLNEARDLAANDKFEFEKWVCGEIGAHGMYHNPGDKGADAGVDGVLEFYPFRMGQEPEKELAIVQVKGGNVTPDAVRALYATVKRFEATAGILVCFADQMTTVENNRNLDMFSDDAADYPVIQGYSIEDLLEHKPLNLPTYRLRDDARLVR